MGQQSYTLLPRLPRRAVWARRAVFAIVVLALGLLFLEAYLPDAGGPRDNIPWRQSLDLALREAKKTGKPVLADFSSRWCPPCQEMKEKTWPDPAVESLVKQDYIPVLLDAEVPESERQFEKYGVEAYPVIMILDPDGNVVRAGHFMLKDEMLEFLNPGKHAG